MKLDTGCAEFVYALACFVERRGGESVPPALQIAPLYGHLAVLMTRSAAPFGVRDISVQHRGASSVGELQEMYAAAFASNGLVRDFDEPPALGDDYLPKIGTPVAVECPLRSALAVVVARRKLLASQVATLWFLGSLRGEGASESISQCVDRLSRDLLSRHHMARVREMELTLAVGDSAAVSILRRRSINRLFACDIGGELLSVEPSVRRSSTDERAVVDELRRCAARPAEWPRSKAVARAEDMGPGCLRVALDDDNDASVVVWDGKRSANVEFCAPGAGGGLSPRTRMALIALMVAIEADNASCPHRSAEMAQGLNNE